jgi:hypothetical protein
MIPILSETSAKGVFLRTTVQEMNFCRYFALERWIGLLAGSLQGLCLLEGDRWQAFSWQSSLQATQL